MLALGETIDDRYKIEKRLHEGAQGVIYLAEDTQLGRKCAIKVLKEHWDDPDSLRRFVQEMDLTAQIAHPSLIKIYGSGIDQEEDMYWYAMEHLEGSRTLSQEIATFKKERSFLPEEKVRSYLAQAAAGLHAIHEVGAIHRDIKAANLLLYDTAEAAHLKILDLGVAHTLDSNLTVVGQALGTFRNMAPEATLFDESVDIDHRADQFSLGVTIYQALTGHYPFPLPQKGMGPLFEAIRNVPHLPPSKHRKLKWHGWDAIFARLLAKKPEERFDSCHSLWGASHTGAEAALEDVRLERSKIKTEPAEIEKSETISANSIASKKMREFCNIEPASDDDSEISADLSETESKSKAEAEAKGKEEEEDSNSQDEPDTEDKIWRNWSYADEIGEEAFYAMHGFQIPKKKTARYKAAAGCAALAILLLFVGFLAQKKSAPVPSTRAVVAKASVEVSPEDLLRDRDPYYRPDLPPPSAPEPSKAESIAAPALEERKPKRRRSARIIKKKQKKIEPHKSTLVAHFYGNAMKEVDSAKSKTKKVTPKLAMGDTIRARLDGALSSSAPGTPALALLAEPVGGMPAGTRFFGKASFPRSGRIGIRFSTIRLPSGEEHPFEGIAMGSDGLAGIKALVQQVDDRPKANVGAAILDVAGDVLNGLPGERSARRFVRDERSDIRKEHRITRNLFVGRGKPFSIYVQRGGS